MSNWKKNMKMWGWKFSDFKIIPIFIMIISLNIFKMNKIRYGYTYSLSPKSTLISFNQQKTMYNVYKTNFALRCISPQVFKCIQWQRDSHSINWSFSFSSIYLSMTNKLNCWQNQTKKIYLITFHVAKGTHNGWYNFYVFY